MLLTNPVFVLYLYHKSGVLNITSTTRMLTKLSLEKRDFLVYNIIRGPGPVVLMVAHRF